MVLPAVPGTAAAGQTLLQKQPPLRPENSRPTHRLEKISAGIKAEERPVGKPDRTQARDEPGRAALASGHRRPTSRVIRDHPAPSAVEFGEYRGGRRSAPSLPQKHYESGFTRKGDGGEETGLNRSQTLFFHENRCKCGQKRGFGVAAPFDPIFPAKQPARRFAGFGGCSCNMVQHVLDFLNFWCTCIDVGWHFGDGIFAFIVEISLIVSAGLFLLKKRHQKKWKKWEENLMKTAFFLFIGAFLVATFLFAPFLEYEKGNRKSIIPAVAEASSQPTNTFIPKIITTNVPESPKPESASTPTNIEPQKTTEIFPTDIGSNDRSEIMRKRAEEKKAVDEKKKEVDKIATQALWQTNLPHYQHALTTLRQLLWKEAQGQRSNLTETNYYPNTLFPAEINQDTNSINIADFGIQNNTNWNFTVSIVRRNEGNAYWRGFDVSCSGGWIEVRPNNEETSFHTWAEFNADIYKDDHADDMEPPAIENFDKAIDEILEYLLEANREYLREKASAHNI